MTIHETYMQRCLQLAQKGLGHVAPNPMVGSVIVYEQNIIGEGYHQQYGKAHAEVNAVNAVENKELLSRSTLYVNLEPCSHHGKTPPCADLIIKHKIPNVVIGSVDFNSVVNGRGIEKLIKAGINVTVGILEEECKELNKRFFTFHQKKRPYIILKWAQTIDGFIDVKRHVENPGKPLQISNVECRKLLHQWRNQEQAIMVGTNTVLLDNPQLTVRESEGKNPLRICIDKWLRIPQHFHIFDKSTPTLIFTAAEKAADTNLEYIKIDFETSVLPQILDELYTRSIQSIIIEGGEQLLNSFINEGLWDEARVFVAEKIIRKGVKAPMLKAIPKTEENINGDKLLTYKGPVNKNKVFKH
jgi:diaminohydroxyphosphoribosylaminopyrimidine deaminase/5-amino-6-(5-phosphoribosylamino)uracil reductase